MKKKLLLIIFILILLTPFFSWLLWYTTPEKPLKVAIIDKTVALIERPEHRCFNWILTNRMFTKSDSSLYSVNDDYFGFFPLEPIEDEKYKIRDFDSLTTEELVKVCDTLDMMYITDTYGVYYNEWYLDSLENEHSRYIYGGTSGNEMFMLEELKRQNKLILCEFNVIASPTSESIRKRFEKTFDMEWTQWTARYFPELDTTNNTDLPKWVVNLYMAQHNGRWPFKKSGIVFVKTDNTLEILEAETDLTYELPTINTNQHYCEKLGVIDSIHYPFWFDIIETGDTNEVISYYNLHTNSRGDSILKKQNIPKKFPASIRHINDYKFYYFAGDFSDNPLPMRSSYFKGVEFIDFLFFEDRITSRTKFFWRYYLPIISKILDKNFVQNKRKPVKVST